MYGICSWRPRRSAHALPFREVDCWSISRVLWKVSGLGMETVTSGLHKVTSGLWFAAHVTVKSWPSFITSVNGIIMEPTLWPCVSALTFLCSYMFDENELRELRNQARVK